MQNKRRAYQNNGIIGPTAEEPLYRVATVEGRCDLSADTDGSLLMGEERAENSQSQGLQQTRDSEQKVENSTARGAGGESGAPPEEGGGEEGGRGGEMGCGQSVAATSEPKPPATSTFDDKDTATSASPAIREQQSTAGGQKRNAESLETQLENLFKSLTSSYEDVVSDPSRVLTRNFFGPSYAAQQKAPQVLQEEDSASQGAQKRKKDLADCLLALGIGRNVDRFLDDLFNPNGGKDEQLELQEFKHRFKEELEISHKCVLSCGPWPFFRTYALLMMTSTLTLSDLNQTAGWRGCLRATSFAQSPRSCPNRRM